MSKSRKHVKNDFLDANLEPTEDQFVARIYKNLSGSIFEIEIPEDKVTFAVETKSLSTNDITLSIARMPGKFRNMLFVKKGSLVIVEPSTVGFQNAGTHNNKGSHNIIAVVSPEQTRSLYQKKMIPECFVNDSMKKTSELSGFSKLQNEDGVFISNTEDDIDLGPTNVCINTNTYKTI